MTQAREGNKLEVPRDLLPGTGQQRITRSRLQQPTAKGDDNCQKSITKLSFFCYLQFPRRAKHSPGVVLNVVHSSDYPAEGEDSRARTYFGDPVVY